MATKASVTLRGRFTEGTEVVLYERGTEIEFIPGQVGDAVATAKTDKNGETSFDVPEGRYWAVGVESEHRPNPDPLGLGTVPVEIRRVAAVTAKVAPRPEPGMRRKQRELTSAAPGYDTRSDVVTGARGSGNSSPSAEHPTTFTDPETGQVSQYASNSVGVPTEGKLEREPAPHLRQEDVGDVIQRSATLTGQATPKDPDELQPRPSQEDLREGRVPGIPADAIQRSATPFGEATPKPADEQQPAARQEETSGIEQRSDTPHGAAVPKLSGDPVENQLAKDNSVVAAVGGPVAKVPSSAKKRASSAKRAPAKKATKAAKKSAAKKGGRG